MFNLEFFYKIINKHSLMYTVYIGNKVIMTCSNSTNETNLMYKNSTLSTFSKK